MKFRPLNERFSAKVDHERSSTHWGGTRCHEWCGCVAKNGYGQINANGKAAYAHRTAWELENGPVPDGQHVLHRCDNRRCVNTGHMFLGSLDDNMADMVAKGRQSKGSHRHTAKLSEVDVLAIRASASKQAELADMFGVTQGIISMIRARRIWRHV